MLNETVNLDWVKNRQFILQDHNGFPIVMDQPNGVSASDLLPLSLIGCSSYDVIAILEKQRQKVLNLAVSAESRRDPDPPFAFRKIHVHYKVSGSDLDHEKVARAIQLSEEKYCGVFATLKKAVEISSDFEIINIKRRLDGSRLFMFIKVLHYFIFTRPLAEEGTGSLNFTRPFFGADL